MKQEMKSVGTPYYYIHHKSIISDVFTRSDICDNYSYTSYADWEIEKTPEANLMKWEFNIDKPETDLKKIGFNINVNEDKTNDMNDEEAVHPSNDLTNDDYSNIEDHETQQEWANRKIMYILLLKKNYNQPIS